MRISNASDLAAIEAVRLSSRQLPASTYDALQATTSRMPDAPALSFFLHADSFDRPFTWTYAELLADITRAANLFRSLGVDGDNPVAFALPNLPETHFTIWGGEAAGIVLAINPMLDASQIGDLLVAAKARVLVTIAPEENPVFWAKLSSEFSRLSDLKTVACVSLATYRSGMKEPGGQRDHGLAFSGIELVDLRKEMAAQPSASLEPPRKILPAPTTTQTSTPISMTCLISLATRLTTCGSIPKSLAPISTSPDIFNRTRLYGMALATGARVRDGFLTAALAGMKRPLSMVCNGLPAQPRRCNSI